jgi:hypothetical protein
MALWAAELTARSATTCRSSRKAFSGASIARISCSSVATSGAMRARRSARSALTKSTWALAAWVPAMNVFSYSRRTTAAMSFALLKA